MYTSEERWGQDNSFTYCRDRYTREQWKPWGEDSSVSDRKRQHLQVYSAARDLKEDLYSNLKNSCLSGGFSSSPHTDIHSVLLLCTALETTALNSKTMSEAKKGELAIRDKAILHQQRRLKQATQFTHKDSADLLPLDGLKRLGTSKDLVSGLWENLKRVWEFILYQTGKAVVVCDTRDSAEKDRN